ncbi:MAG: biopolymer transporter ExbD [Muribaculaceae bacterium]|nr:biopolymer transporter ExbD [Muribaculaceae bacterium]
MGKVKIKRKSTLIDMTAMSDVTVLLLTFFMLTSTFLQKEPTIVYTPSSVSEEKVPMNNLVTVLVSSADKSGKLDDPSTVEGKLFISFTGDADSVLSSGKIRGMMLDEAVAIYNEQHKNSPISITAAQKQAFMETNMFGTSFQHLPGLLSLSVTERDKEQGDLTNPNVGIPIDDNKNRDGRLNDFQIWLKAIYNVAQRINNDQREDPSLSEEQRANLNNLYTALMRKGQGIAIKADKDTPFTTVQRVFDNLQTMKLNKFSLMTALKSEDEPTQ